MNEEELAKKKKLYEPYLSIYIKESKLEGDGDVVVQIITEIQRKMLMDWIFEVCDLYKLSTESFLTTAYIFDKYIQGKNIRVSQLQLVAAVSLMIAAKYEETFFPAMSEYVYLCDGLYTVKDFRDMQCEVLKAIGYRITRVDARFLAFSWMEKKPREIVDIETFYSAIDCVSLSIAWSKRLTFINQMNLGRVIIDTVVNGVEVDLKYKYKDIKLELASVIPTNDDDLNNRD